MRSSGEGLLACTGDIPNNNVEERGLATRVGVRCPSKGISSRVCTASLWLNFGHRVLLRVGVDVQEKRGENTTKSSAYMTTACLIACGNLYQMMYFIVHLRIQYCNHGAKSEQPIRYTGSSVTVSYPHAWEHVRVQQFHEVRSVDAKRVEISE